MITLQDVRTMIQKTAALSCQIGQIDQLMHQVVQLSEELQELNEDLTLEQDRMTAKIRSVEVLGEVLRTHVYGVKTKVPFHS